jgi:hypothetical protein
MNDAEAQSLDELLPEFLHVKPATPRQHDRMQSRPFR